MFRKLSIFLRITREFGVYHALNYSLAWLFRQTVNSSTRDFLKIPVFDKKPQLTELLSGESYDESAPLVWFVPSWSNVWGGGHFTIFRFAHQISAHRRNIIYVYNNEGRNSAQYFRDSLNQAFDHHSLEVVVNPSELPKNSIPLATTWQSVYSLLEYCTPGSLQVLLHARL